MTAAVPDHTHHCSCPKLPPDLWERIAGGYSKYGEAFCRDLLRVITGSRNHTSPAVASSHRPRFLTKVTPPDASGHQHYLGAWPRWGVPRVMFQGRTLDITAWLWTWNSLDFAPLPDDGTLVRTCRDPMCVSPDHHKLPAPPKPAELYSRELLIWEAAHPKPHNPRSVNWQMDSGYTGERCQANHPIHVYQVRPRKSYCAECAAIMRTWVAERKAKIREIDSRMTGLPPRVPNQPQLPPYEQSYSPEPPRVDAQPSLVDQLLAMGAWDKPEAD